MRRHDRWAGCFALLTFLITTASTGQPLHKPLRFITTRDGLPQAFVSDMVQDKDGFVWLGTPNGLARYDGLHVKLFQHNSSDTTTMASNAILRLQLDRQNRIWIFYENNEIDFFDPVAEKVTHITAFVQQKPLSHYYLVTHEGNIWANYGDGLYLHNFKTARTAYFSAKTGQLISDTILAMQEDRQDRTWVMTTSGLSVYQPGAGRFQPFPAPFPIKFGKSSQIGLHERSNGELIFGDTGKVVIFNPAKSSYRSVALPHPVSGGVIRMQTGPDGSDYLETRTTLYRYDDRHGLIALLNIPDYSVWSPIAFLIDRSGLLWLGLNIDGVAQFDFAAITFEVYPNAGSFHRAVLARDFGESIAPFLNEVFPEYAVGTSSGRPNYLFRSVWDRSNGFWAGFKDKVARFNPVNHQWQMLPPIPGYPNATASLRSMDIAQDGKLWVMNDHSVYFFDPAKQAWKSFINTASDKTDTTLLFNSNAIKADTHKLWITRGSDLLSMDIATRHIDIFNKQTKPGLLPADQLLGLEPDPTRPHLLWIGTREGLVCLNKRTLTSEIFTTKQGLPDNVVYAVQTDKNGFLWLSTNKGLCRFHPVTHELRLFTAQDGLPGNEFNTLQYLKLKDNRLAFGGVDGWVAFNPGVIKPDTFQPKIAFTGLKIYNEPVNYAPGNKLLPRPLNDVENLVLPYDQNTLTFEFAGLEYNQPGLLKYRYQLEGYDDKWVMTDNPVVAYTKLSAGLYHLKINCTNTTGQWSNHTRSLAIRILPPWWRTWWAYTQYVLAAAVIGFLLYRDWLQQVKARQKIILQQKEAEQLKALDEMKSRFFSNITHEFRTPLSLIIAPAEQLQKQNMLPEHQKQVGTIQRNAQQLLHVINQLLDMAKLEAASMKISLFRGSIYQFVQLQLQSFTSAAAEKKINLRVTGNNDGEEYLFDADKLHTILSNLVSNAIKFTPDDGSIDISVYQQEADDVSGTFTFTVQDSGIGIPADKLPFIFNRFYQADDSRTRNYQGTGIGLALAKELTELMQATLTATSELNKGTTFTLTVTLTKAKDTAVPAYMMKQAEAAIMPVENNLTDEPLSQAMLLIVEDNKELNEFIAQTFRRYYRVITAVNGLEGLRIANEELPDIIISDLMMPEMDGYAFCKVIKNNAATNHIAFLLLTGRAAPDKKIEGLQSGADDYLTKPFIAEELQLRVANMLSRQQQLRQYFQSKLIVKPAENITVKEVPATHPFLEKLYAIVDANLDDEGFSVDKLATKAAVSERTLQRKLATLIGLSPVEVIKQYRLKKATEFLKQGMGVAETTYMIGYESPAYFSTLFKSVYGVTPSEYASMETP